MTAPLYAHRRFWGRYIALLVFLAAIFVYGWFELWRALRLPSTDESNGILFGAIFVGGSLIALRQLLQEYRDLVVTLDGEDGEGTLTATVFGAFGATRLSAPTADFTSWRLYRKPVSRRAVALFILVDCPGRPRPLRFDLKSNNNLSGLRRLAPEAFAEFETAIAPAPTAAKS